MIRRVVVTGSECTGKTTLAAALADHYRTVWVPEYAREYVSARGSPPVAEDVEPIAKGQMRSEDVLARPVNRLLILDTDLISTAIYSRHYFGGCPAWIEEEIRRRKADVYLLAGIDVPWEPDGDQRDRGDRREEMQDLFREALVRRGIPYVELTGSHSRRLETATRAIDPLLGDPQPAR